MKFCHYLLKALHRFFEVLKDFCGEHVRIGQVVEVGKRLVLDPENIEAGFVAGQDFVDAVAAEAAFRILRRPGFAALVPILRMIAGEKLVEILISERVLLECEMDIGTKIVNPDLARLRFRRGRTFVEKDHVRLDARLVEDTRWQA